jgi:hypothetical protein
MPIHHGGRLFFIEPKPKSWWVVANTYDDYIDSKLQWNFQFETIVGHPIVVIQNKLSCAHALCGSLGVDDMTWFQFKTFAQFISNSCINIVHSRLLYLHSFFHIVTKCFSCRCGFCNSLVVICNFVIWNSMFNYLLDLFSMVYW